MGVQGPKIAKLVQRLQSQFHVYAKVQITLDCYFQELDSSYCKQAIEATEIAGNRVLGYRRTNCSIGQFWEHYGTFKIAGKIKIQISITSVLLGIWVCHFRIHKSAIKCIYLASSKICTLCVTFLRVSISGIHIIFFIIILHILFYNILICILIFIPEVIHNESLYHRPVSSFVASFKWPINCGFLLLF